MKACVIRLFSESERQKLPKKIPRYGLGFSPPKGGWVWARAVRFRTVEANRLSAFSRYRGYYDEIDVKKTSEVAKLDVTDLRWDDHRKVFFRCPTCDQSYRRSVASRVKYGVGCPRCSQKWTSSVLREQLESAKPLSDTMPQCAALCVSAPKVASSFPATSQFIAMWKCPRCQKTFSASIRSKSGASDSRMMNFDPRWTALCASCLWESENYALGEKAKCSGGFLGFESPYAQFVPKKTLNKT